MKEGIALVRRWGVSPPSGLPPEIGEKISSTAESAVVCVRALCKDVKSVCVGRYVCILIYEHHTRLLSFYFPLKYTTHMDVFMKRHHTTCVCIFLLSLLCRE